MNKDNEELGKIFLDQLTKEVNEKIAMGLPCDIEEISKSIIKRLQGGLPPPEIKKAYSICLYPSDKRKLEILAKKMGISGSSLLTKFIHDFIESKEKELGTNDKPSTTETPTP